MGLGHSRARAIALHAANIREVLSKKGLSWLSPALTASQWQQLQQYLDSVVVDPAVKREAAEYYRNGTKYYGSISVTDPAMKRRAEMVLRQYIIVGKWDDRVRLELKQMLDADALKPTTDNPDEAAYLERVRATLNERGVWLRLAQKMVRRPDDPSSWMYDPRQFEAWLSFGPNGDTIPVKAGRIDREALLGTVAIGAGYWREVDRGPAEKALERELNRLSMEIDGIMTQHAELARIRRTAFPGVTAASDALGGASFPPENIWEGPHKLVLRAWDLRNAGKIYGCRAMLVVAALATRNAARLLSKYIDDTSSGAGRAVKVLEVAKTAGKVAEVGLAITGVGALALSAGGATAGGVAVTEATVDAVAEREVAKYLAKNPELATELQQVRLAPGPKGTILGNVRGGHSAGYGKGFQSW